MKEKLIMRVLVRLTIAIFGLIVSYFLLLKLNVEYIGVIAISTSLIGLFTIFKDLGFGLIYFQHNSDDDFDDYFSIFFFIQTILTLINFLPLFIFVFFLGLDPLVLNFLFLKLLSDFFLFLSLTWITNLESRLKYMKLEITIFIVNILKDSLLILIILNLEKFENPLITIGQIYILVSLIQLILVLMISRREFQFKKINKATLKQFIKETRPIIKVIIISSILGNLGQIFINYFYGLEALAYYYFANTYVIAVLLIISAQIHQILQTYIPKEFKEENFGNTENIVHAIEKFSSMFYLIIIIIVLLNGALLLDLFLPNYSPAIIFLYILIFIPYLSSINRPYSALLIPFKKQRLQSNYDLIKSIIWTGLILIIVPPSLFSINMLGFGAIGLAVLILSGHILDFFFLRYFLKKIGIDYNKKTILQLLFAIIAYLLALFISEFILSTLFNKDLFYILISSGLAIILFLLILILFREIKREDVKFIITLFKISAYKDSLKDEIKKAPSIPEKK